MSEFHVPKILQKLECPHCCMVFKNPSTLPCGHSFCVEETKSLSACAVCTETLPQNENKFVNYVLRDIVAHVSAGELSKAKESDLKIIDFVECPICFNT